MAIDTQLQVYEKKRGDANARLNKIKGLISAGDFGEAFVSAITNLGDLIDDACATGETMKFMPVAKSETLRRIGIVKLEHIDELVTIAGMPKKLRKVTYDECSPDFKKAFPDPEAIKAANDRQKELVRRMVPLRKGVASVNLVPENRPGPRRIQRDSRPARY